mgnify:CR=1 FL=1
MVEFICHLGKNTCIYSGSYNKIRLNERMVAFVAAISAAAFTAKAGGYVTDTDQNVAFLRNPARNAAIGVQL